MIIKLHNVRLAFPQLFVPKAVNGEGPAAYSASLIFGRNHPAVKIVKAAIDEVGAAKFLKEWPKIKAMLERQDRTCLHDGDNKEYSGFPGNYYISARNQTRPTVIDVDKSPLTQADGRPYAGCYVAAHLDIWPQNNQYGQRINASLTGIQFFRDGEAFTGGAPASPDAFDDLSDTGGDTSSQDEDDAPSDLA